MAELDHLFGLREAAARAASATRIITADIAVDEAQHRPIFRPARKQALVVQPGIHLEGHDRDLLLWIIAGSDKRVESLLAPRRLLIKHLIGMRIEAVGVIFKPTLETLVKIPMRVSESDP